MLANTDIDQLAQYVELERTPVIVVDRLDYLMPHEAFREAESIRQTLSRWRKHLSQMDIDGNGDLWSGSEEAREALWSRWRIFRHTQDPRRASRLHFANVSIFRAHRQVVVTFDWNLSDQQDPWRRGRLYLSRSPQGYRIVDAVLLPLS